MFQKPVCLLVTLGLCFTGHAAFAQLTTCQPTFKFDPGFGFTALFSNPVLADVAVWDADGLGPNQPQIVLAGVLTRLGNVTTNDMVIAFNQQTGTWSGVGGGFSQGDGSATAVAVSPSGELHVAGFMSQLGGTPGGGPQTIVQGLARWDGTQWNPLGTTANFNIFDMVFEPDGDLIVGGAFTSRGNVPGTACVARWDGTSWNSMGGGLVAGGSVNSLAIDRFGVIYASGQFPSTNNGVTVNNITKFVAGQWQAIGSGLGAFTNEVIIDPITDQPIASGQFLTNEPGFTINEQTRIARWDGSSWRAMGPGPNGNNTAGDIGVGSDGTILALFGAQLRAYNRASNSWSPISPVLNAQRFDVLPDGDILLSGAFTTIDGQTAPRVIRFGKSKECPYLEADFTNSGPLNLGWITTWNGGNSGAVLQEAEGVLAGDAVALAAAELAQHVFFRSSAAWRGDRSGAYGGRIRIVAERSGVLTCNGPATNTFADMILEGADLELHRQSADAAVLRNRLVFTAPLDNSDGGWRVGSIGGPVASAQQVRDVLGRFASIRFNLNTPKQNPCSGDATYGRTLKLDSVQMFTVPLQTSFNFTRERTDGNVGDAQGWSGDGDTTILTAPAPGVLLSDENPNGPWRNLIVPAAGLGNMGQFYGDSIFYQLKTDIIQENLPLPLLTLESAFGDVLEYYGPTLPGIDSFNIFSVPLSATGFTNGTGWLIEGSAVSPSENQMRRTLDNLANIKIRCEFSQTGDTAEFKSYLITTDFSGNLCDSIDFNNDGSFFDPQDINAFLSVYSEGPCIPANATCNDIDFNNDTSLFDPQDIQSFLSVYSEGPCI